MGSVSRGLAGGAPHAVSVSAIEAVITTILNVAPSTSVNR
jgi:hypothetical protein